MFTPRTIRIWQWLHEWPSLICTLFLLMLCLTGLPLIFHHELDHLLGNTVEPPAMAEDAPRASLDEVVDAGLRQFPGEAVQYVVWDPDEVNAVTLIIAPKPDAPPDQSHFVVVDARTAQVLGEPPSQEGIMHFLLTLHVEMFAGIPGKLFLGAMGLLFVVSLVSGVVLYAPFMRRLDFGTVRRHRSRRVRWLDLHNLLGIVTLVWALVVGLTGAINACADLVLQLWQYDQLAAMIAPYEGQPAPQKLGSVDQAVVTAMDTVEGMTPSFVAYPGTPFTSDHHYAVFLRGQTPLTARLVKPALIDAETGAFTDARDMPWYVTTLLVSQPLHFGDYGGMPLKIIWALFDVATIIVLASGVYLWVARRWKVVAPRVSQTDDHAALAVAAHEVSP